MSSRDGDEVDTKEYLGRGRRARPSQAPRRPSKGYWIGPEGDGAGARRDAPPSAGASNATPAGGRRTADPRGAARGAAPGRAKPRRNRRILLWMGLSLTVLVALVIAAVLVLTGETIVPGISDKLFPMHYQEEIARAADKYGQDPYLIAAMVRTESGFDPTAESPAGAVGLMQLMPDTADWVVSKIGKWPGGDGPVLTDPADSLELGTYYIAYLGGIYGDGSVMALAAYNAGQGRVDEWVEAAGGRQSFDESDIPFPETKQYVQRVEHYRRLYMRLHPDAFTQTSK